jgi:PAS domain S-box-containing protein
MNMLTGRTVTRQITAADLERAISGNQIEPAFQPLIRLDEDTTVGYEVLARWTDPFFGPVSPLDFIAIAEEHSLIGKLTRQIIAKACQHATSLDRNATLAFNLSPVQFRNATLFNDVSGAIAKAGVPFERVVIEITESALIDDEALALATIRKFKQAGFGIALDDFGTGFSSLTRLHSFPFDKLKIDASFVRTMETDPGSRKIVAAVVGLGQSLGMSVVAEGVETAAQLFILKRLGCDIGQGYLLGRPMPAAQLVDHSLYPPGKMPSRRGVISPLVKLHQLETIYQGAPIALAFLDTAGRYVSANDRYARVLGEERTCLIGQSAADAFADERRAVVARIARRILAGRPVIEREVVNRRTNRSYVLSCSRIVDDGGEVLGLSISLIDVTRRKRAEAALRADEEHFRLAIEVSPNVAWAARTTGEVYYMSPALSGGAHVAVEDRIRNWYERMHAEDRVRVRQEWLATISDGTSFQTEFRILWSDDRWRWVRSEAVLAPGADGKAHRWFGVMTDITARRALEEQVDRLQNRVGNSADEILQLFRP